MTDRTDDQIIQWSPLDLHFAGFLDRLASRPSRELALAASLVSRQTGDGHVCLDLDHFAGGSLVLADGTRRTCPALGEWLAALEESGVAGSPAEKTPLVLVPPRLYLARYFRYEATLAAFVMERSVGASGTSLTPALEEGLDRLFGSRASAGSTERDWQREAARSALVRRFSVISGGPGTGKTTTVAAVLALFLEARNGDPFHIALAAPTGKAAARLQEAIVSAKGRLSCPAGIKEAIPEKAMTLHRLLGRSRHGVRYHAADPLPCDLVVVDEASMVDLPLMARLVEALPHSCSLVLLGDRDQLASVEPGAVLGDICQGLGDRPELSPAVTELRESYRFQASSGIGAVSRAVNSGDGEEAFGLLTGGGFADLAWRDISGLDPEEFGRMMLERLAAHHREIMRTAGPEEALAAAGRFAVLTALRQGPMGAERLNRLAARALGGRESASGHFPGRPVMITRNDYNRELYNGDTGLVLETGNGLRACFPRAGGVRSLLLPQLPAHETAFALTVHKSQGSEFDHVVLILPPEPSPILCRELIYTGLTRARKSVEVWGGRRVFVQAVGRGIARRSGLVQALQGQGSHGTESAL